MTVGLREGYEGNQIHEVSEVIALVKRFAVDHNIEFGAEIRSTTVVYSYQSDGRMIVKEEPGANISGLFPPNKFGELSDEKLVEIIGSLAGYLAGPLGQTSFHAEVCGCHYSWKRAGQLTAHEAAKQSAASEMKCPHVTKEQLVEELGRLSRHPVLTRALHLAEEGHRGQTRIGGGSVLEEHIYPVCLDVAKGACSRSLVVVVAAALCHDLLEDTTVSLEQIQAISAEVAKLVEVLTEKPDDPYGYFRGIADNPDALLIKVMDRLNNLSCAYKITDKAEIHRLCRETERYLLDAAGKLNPAYYEAMTEKLRKLVPLQN